MAREHSAVGVEHLQRAAHELIAAAREFLDAAEELVDDREVVREAADLLGGVVREVGRLGSRVRRSDGRPFETDLDDRDHSEGFDGGDPSDDRDGPSVSDDRTNVKEDVRCGNMMDSTERAKEGHGGEGERERAGRPPRGRDVRGDSRASTSRVRRIDVE